MSSNAPLEGPPSAVAAVAVAAASVVVLDPGGWFPFSIAKWPAVATLALIAGAVALWTGPTTRAGRRAQRARRRVIAALWIVLLVLVTISTLAGLDGRMAWFGTPVRHLGAMTWMIFALLFAVGVQLGPQRVLLRGILIVGGVLGAYTAWEVLVGAPVEYVTNSSRAGGPYGSAAYLGAACCLFLPIAVGLASDSDEPARWRTGASVVTVSLVGATAASGSRGAVVALMVTGVAVAALRGRSAIRRGVVPAAAAATGATVVVVAVVAVAVVAVATDVFERSVPADSRIDEWRLGLRALSDRPLMGFGPEGYRLVVDRSLTADYVRDYGDAVLPDRAHNAVLDVALSSGVFAAIAFVGICVCVVAAGLRLIRHGSVAHVGLGGAAIAFVVQQQFLFPIAEIDAVFWIVAGVAIGAARPSTCRGRATEVKQAAAPGATSAALVRRAASAALVALAVIVAIGGVRSVAADRVVRRATVSGDVEQSITDAARAVDLDPHDVRLRVVLARSFEGRRTLGGVDLAIESVDGAAAISPLDPTVLRERARLASLRASITGSLDDRGDALERWQAMVDLAPNCASCLRSLGLTQLDAGSTAEALGSLQRAAELGDERAAAMLDELSSS